MRHLLNTLGIAVGLVIGGAVFSSQASATLLGVEIQGSLEFGVSGVNFFDPAQLGVPPLPPGSSNIQPSAIVDDVDATFVEFQYQDGFSGINVDVDAETIFVEQFLTDPSAPSGAGSWDIVISDLIWAGTPGEIVGLNIVNDTFAGGLTTDFTASSVSLSFTGGFLTVDGFQAEIELITRHDIPVPAPVALLGLGLVALGAAGRRRA